MLNISNAFKQELAKDNRAYLVWADITLADGTDLHLENKDIWNGGFKFEEAVSANNDFQIGAAIIGKHTIIINNIYDDFSDYNFDNAKVVSYVGLKLPDGKTEKIHKGTYFVDEPTYNGSLITLNCLDMMEKFDRPYSESKQGYPATLGEIVQDACSCCNMVLATSTFDNDSYIVQTRPDDESLTFRDIISFVAQISGHWAKTDVYGSLVFGWYKQGTFEKDFVNGGIFDKQDPEVYKTGADVYGGSFAWDDGDTLDGGTFEDQKAYHHIFSHKSFSIGTDDVVITGIQVKDTEQDSEPVLWGDTGYVISVENNDLILPGQAGDIAEYLGKRIVGLRFRAFSVSHANDPSIEAGDLAFISDRKGNSYNSFITNTTFSVGQDQQSSCGAQSVSKNSSTRYSQATRGIVEARKMVEKERTEREKAIENLAEKLSTSSGLYMTPEVQPDGSTIYYMHNKPTKEGSDIIWKLTAEAFAVSIDGGQSYPYGFTVDGELITRLLSTEGFLFDWAKGGTLTLGGKDNGNGVLKILDAAGTQVGYIDNTGVHFENGSISLGDMLYAFSNGMLIANNLISNNANITGGSIHIDTEESSYSAIVLRGNMEQTIEGGWNATYRTVFDHSGMETYIYPLGKYAAGFVQGVKCSGSSISVQGYSGTVENPVSDGNGFSVMSVSKSAAQLFLAGNQTINGNFYLFQGTKSKVVGTKDFGAVCQYCYETPTPMFGDIGEGFTDENGECIIDIDSIFGDTVTTNVEYQVFLQKEGEGDIWVESKDTTYFTVKGTPNLKFAWELKAVQRDYEYYRLDEFVDSERTPDGNYEEPFISDDVIESMENSYIMEMGQIISEQEKIQQEMEELLQ